MHRLAPYVLLLTAGAALSAAPRQQPSARTTAHPIEAVHVTGHKRYSAEQVVRVSGLVPGKSVSVAELDGLITRMAGTGLFSKVGYKYGPDATGNRLVITFEIEEPEWKIPVILDNFVWFSDAQLHAALADDVPSFNGTLPATDGIHPFVVQSLQRFLKANGIERQVEFLTYTHEKTKVLKYLFKVIDPTLRVCGLSLRGISPKWEKQFAPAVAAQIGQPYSRVSLEGLTQGELADAYRSRGLLDATISAPDPRLNGGCEGVSVSALVTEGDPYTWERTTWNGNALISTAELDRVLGVRAGASADTAALDAGLLAIRGAYGNVGHIQAQLSVSTHRDQATKRARLDVQVAEGPQFRMGTLQLAGLTDADAAKLAKSWKLKPGQVFDASYLGEFRRELLAVQKQRRLMMRGPIATADVTARTVNVRYEFAPPKL